MGSFVDFLHRIYDVPELIKWAGYFGLTLIIFSETGLLLGIFLPGDSVLVTAGLFATQGYIDIVLLGLLLNCAAIVGNNTGYFIGRKTGPRIFKREDSLLFNRKHLIRSHDFYEKHGGRTIVLAQFMPIVRTFAPLIAGIAGMNYRHFLGYTVVGAVLWIWGMLLTGYFLATYVPGVVDHIELVIVGVVFLSLLPGIIGWLRSQQRARAVERKAVS